MPLDELQNIVRISQAQAAQNSAQHDIQHHQQQLAGTLPAMGAHVPNMPNRPNVKDNPVELDPNKVLSKETRDALQKAGITASLYVQGGKVHVKLSRIDGHGEKIESSFTVAPDFKTSHGTSDKLNKEVQENIALLLMKQQNPFAGLAPNVLAQLSAGGTGHPESHSHILNSINLEAITSGAFSVISKPPYAEKDRFDGYMLGKETQRQVKELEAKGYKFYITVSKPTPDSEAKYRFYAVRNGTVVQTESATIPKNSKEFPMGFFASVKSDIEKISKKNQEKKAA